MTDEQKVAWIARVTSTRGCIQITVPSNLVRHLKLKRHDLVMIAMGKIVREEKLARQ